MHSLGFCLSRAGQASGLTRFSRRENTHHPNVDAASRNYTNYTSRGVGGAVRVVRALAVCPGSCPGCPGCLRSWGGRGCPGCPGFSCLSGLVSGLSGCRWAGLSGLSRALAVCLGSSVRAVRRVFGGGWGRAILSGCVVWAGPLVRAVWVSPVVDLRRCLHGHWHLLMCILAADV